jgi:hypothetical protein
MAIKEIAVISSLPNYEFKTDLDSVTYILALRYNSRMDRWIMDIKTEDDDPIIMGRPILLGVSLLAQYVDPRLPDGDIFAINLGTTIQEAGKEDLGSNVLLLYQEAN